MPVAAVTSVLEAGFLPMLTPATAPITTVDSANRWAEAYVNYVVAGGIPAAVLKQAALGAALASAFVPEQGPAGVAQLLQALLAFWIGLPVPAQLGVVTAFIPLAITPPPPPLDTPQDQARGLAQSISTLTLTGVFVTVPPGVVVPLL